MRLQVYLAKAGVASRRAAEDIIASGRVAVNDEIITGMGFKVENKDRVTLDGQPVKPIEILVYLAVHKPVAVICTQSDEQGRTKVIDLIPENLRPGLFHVGRLDFMSSGLIFLSNDGAFGKIVTHPSSEIEKEYLLESLTPLPGELLRSYRRGIDLEGESLKAKNVTQESPTRARLVLAQGKNREIRRVCESFGVQVRRLLRVRIGCVTLDGISPGRFRRLTDSETAWFLNRDAGPARPTRIPKNPGGS